MKRPRDPTRLPAWLMIAIIVLTPFAGIGLAVVTRLVWR